MKNPLIISAATLLSAGLPVSGAVIYSAAGSGYSQNFDSLSNNIGTAATWEDNVTLQGWYAAQNLTGQSATPFTSYLPATGAANQGLLGSMGSSGSTDRALGGQNANGTVANPSRLYYGLQVTNSTGGLMTTFNLAYTGEQWRFVVDEARDSMQFEYQIFAAGTGSLTAASGWTTVASLGFDAPIVSTAASNSLDGNSSANRVNVSGSVSGISWANGSELWLRWVDSNTGSNATTGRRANLAIDDLSFSAVPEPSAMLLGGVGLLGLLRRRRC